MNKEIAHSKKTKAKRILLSVLAVILVLDIAGTVANIFTVSSKTKLASSHSGIDFEEQLVPQKDADGDWAFTTDREFKVLQLTDIHFGGGWMSAERDVSAMAAVATMIEAEKPDLVVVTGDMAYPVPFQAGTFNNKNGAVYLAELMESLGVYWTLSFGNHDTEAYSLYDREAVSEFYLDEKYEHCIFEKGPDDVDGFGNQVIKVKNSEGLITQALFVFDSHSYIDGDYFGIFWKYDDVHDNQIEWYKKRIEQMNSHNQKLNGKSETVKSLVFLHIPFEEYLFAWQEFAENGYKDTENVKYKYGIVGETGKLVYSGIYENNLFETMLELGSTQGVFCGHDHFNNFSVNYKGIDLTYGYSVDYLAYIGIDGKGSQRGCTVITTKPDGTYDFEKHNLYESGRYEMPEGFDEEIVMQFDGVKYQYIEEK